MIDLASALLPVFGLVVLGAVLRRVRLLSDDQWRGLDALLYVVMMPALIVALLLQVDFAALELGAVAAAILGAILANAALLAALRPWLGLSGPAFTSVFQGVVRNNVFIVLAVGQLLFGAEGAALVVIAAALNLPIVNLLSVAVLVRHGGGGRGVLTALARNPLILAAAVGFALNLLAAPVPGFVVAALELLGDGVLALALLAVGAGLQPRAAVAGAGGIAVSALGKLLLMPALAWLICWALGAAPLATAAAVLFHSAPTAPSAYILARRLGGDAELMGAILTAQTMLAALTMPLVLLAFG